MLKVTKAELALGLFCFLLFFVVNPNCLVAPLSKCKVFFLNVFLFAPYIALSIESLKNAVGVKIIPCISICFFIFVEFMFVQAKLVFDIPEFVSDAWSSAMAVFNVFIFLWVAIDVIARNSNDRR